MSAHSYFLAAAVIVAVSLIEWCSGFTAELTMRTAVEKVLYWLLRVAHLTIWCAVGILIARGLLA
mgnify:CR=1 FL=1